MSETIKEHVEQNDSSEILSNEKDNFNPDKARELQAKEVGDDTSERDTKKDAELESIRSNVTEAYTAKRTKAEQNVERYTELLDDIVEEDYGDADDISMRKKMAHGIVDKESTRRLEERKNLARKQATLDRLQELENKYAKRGFFGKMFGKNDYEDQRESLERLMRANEAMKVSNEERGREIDRRLADYYDDPISMEDGTIDYTKITEHRKRFFGEEGSDRAEKVNAAIKAFGSSDVITLNNWQKQAFKKEA